MKSLLPKILPSIFTLLSISSVLPVRAQSPKVNPIEIRGWDLSQLNTRIAEAAARTDRKEASANDRLSAAAAYLERANIFYAAGQPSLYKLALGDFRRVLRLQPDNSEARERMEMIVSIYESFGRPVPDNGNEKSGAEDPASHLSTKPAPIMFEAGETSKTIRGDVPSGTAYLYEVGGKAGQEISIDVKSEGGAAAFTIYKAGPQQPNKVIAEGTTWSGALPETGVCLIKIFSATGTTSYTLRVEFK